MCLFLIVYKSNSSYKRNFWEGGKYLVIKDICPKISTILHFLTFTAVRWKVGIISFAVFCGITTNCKKHVYILFRRLGQGDRPPPHLRTCLPKIRRLHAFHNVFKSAATNLFKLSFCPKLRLEINLYPCKLFSRRFSGFYLSHCVVKKNILFRCRRLRTGDRPYSPPFCRLVRLKLVVKYSLSLSLSLSHLKDDLQLKKD